MILLRSGTHAQHLPARASREGMDATSAAGQSSASSVDGEEAQVPLRRPPSLTGEVPLRQVGGRVSRLLLRT